MTEQTLQERLRRRAQLQPAFGYGYIGGAGYAGYKIIDDGKRLVNPDGPEAADALDAKDAEIAELRAKLARAAKTA